jgi:hypothetical protein
MHSLFHTDHQTLPLQNRLWALGALMEMSAIVHASTKLPCGVTELGVIIKRGAPHTLPLWFIISEISGVVSFAVKAGRLSRFSDPDAIVENVFCAICFATYCGPWCASFFHPLPPSSPLALGQYSILHHFQVGMTLCMLYFASVPGPCYTTF